MQLRYDTNGLTFQAYIKHKEHEKASLDACPECHRTVKPWGYYPRKFPRCFLVRRYYCPPCHMTISLLPDFAAAGMPGLLGEIEAAAVTWEETGSNTDACPPRIVQKARWMHQHLQLVYSLLRVLTTLYPDRFGSLEPRILSFRSALQVECVLEELRTTLGLLQALPRPVGFAVPQLGGIPP